jgi:hypothetical protein
MIRAQNLLQFMGTVLQMHILAPYQYELHINMSGLRRIDMYAVLSLLFSIKRTNVPMTHQLDHLYTTTGFLS